MYYKDTDKTEVLKRRTKQFAVEIISNYKIISKSEEGRLVGRQLLRSASSMAANNRAACRARSKAEFYSKLSIVVEESDESVFWLEILADANIPNAEKLNLKHLFDEAFELLKIFSSSRKTAKNNLISSNHKFNQENNGYLIVDAQVVELVDTQDLKSCGRLGRAGSSPALGTPLPLLPSEI